jgi:ABC-type sugar transport system ATPase subunit
MALISHRVHVLLDGTTRFSVQKDGKTVPPRNSRNTPRRTVARHRVFARRLVAHAASRHCRPFERTPFPFVSLISRSGSHPHVHGLLHIFRVRPLPPSS